MFSMPYIKKLPILFLNVLLSTSCTDNTIKGSFGSGDSNNNSPADPSENSPLAPILLFSGFTGSILNFFSWAGQGQPLEWDGNPGSRLPIDILPSGVDPTFLVGYFSFNAGSLSDSSTINDLSSYAQIGTLTTSDANEKSISGKVGQALEFDGINDYVALGNPSHLQITGAITVSAWVRSDINQNQYLVTKGNLGSRGFDLNTDMGTTHSLMNFRISSDCTSIFEAISLQELTSGTWYHVVGTYQPGQYVRLYINGRLETEVSYGIPASQCDPGQGVNFGTPDNISFFKGALDEVYIFNRVLSDNEISSLGDREANLTSPVLDANKSVSWKKLTVNITEPAGIDLPINSENETIFSSGNVTFQKTGAVTHSLLQLRLDEEVLNSAPSGSDFEDTSGNNLHATESGGVSPGQNGAINRASHFDGVDDYITVPDSPSFTGLTAITFMAWVKPDLDPGSSWGRVLTKMGPTFGTEDFSIILKTSFEPVVRIKTTTGGTFEKAASAVFVKKGSWSHLAGVWDGIDLRLYLDGSLVGTPLSTSGSILSNSNQVLSLGADTLTVPLANRAITGSIDSVHIFNRALSSAQIAAIYRRALFEYKFQVHACNQSDCLDKPFVGPGGDQKLLFEDYHYIGGKFPFLDIASENLVGRYMQYRLHQEFTGVSTPIIKDVVVENQD